MPCSRSTYNALVVAVLAACGGNNTMNVGGDDLTTTTMEDLSGGAVDLAGRDLVADFSAAVDMATARDLRGELGVGVDLAVPDLATPDLTTFACTPNTFQRCDGGNLITCNGSGTGEVARICPSGCSQTAMKCNVCVP